MRRGDPRAKPRQWSRMIAALVPVLLLVVIVIGGIYRAAWNGHGVTLFPVERARAAPSLGPRTHPQPTLSEDAPGNVGTAATQPPSRALVLAFELAYFTPDPKLRVQRLKAVATPQYISDSVATTSPVKTDGLVDAIDAKKSMVQITCDQAYLSCTEQSQIWLIMSRNGALVQAFLAPPHATEWIFTTAGWKAANATDPR